MEILLDTSFIITCARQKIDFSSLADEATTDKVNFILPQEVLNELNKISERKGEKIGDKQAAKLSISLLKELNPKIIKLGSKITDNGISDYLKQHNKTVLATLDKNLKKKSGSTILTIAGKKKLELQ